MKKVAMILMFVVLFTSIVYAAEDTTNQDIIIDSQIREIYNLGDGIPISLKISSTTDISGKLNLDLICEGHKKELMSISGYTIDSANRKEIGYDLSLKNVNDLVGSCKLRASFGDDITIEEFELSDKLNVSIKEVSEKVEPGKFIIVKGDVLKQNPSYGGFEGFYSLNLDLGKKTEKKEGVVENGFFKINTSIPGKIAAGEYTGEMMVYEKDSNGKTNIGEADFKFSVSQVPTNLEIVIEEDKIKPGNEVKIKSILHDQTGKNIARNVTITIRDSSGKIIKKENKQTGEFLTFELDKDTLPGKWNVTSISKNMKSEADFEILKNKEVDVNLMNNTVFIKNTGNIHYNGSVDVKIGNETIKVPASLERGEEKKYYLSAPEGNYTVEILADGEKRLKQNVQLTGRSVDVKENLEGSFIRNPVVWGFVIIVLGIVLYIVFKKGYKRSFVGRTIHHKKDKKKKSSKEKQTKEEKTSKKSKESENQETQKEQGILPKYHNKAELSLSIKGNKQDANLICLKIKNYDEVKQNTEGVKDTLHKVVKKAEQGKAHIYEANDNIFFIFAPEITKTFKNEGTAIKTAKEIESDIRNHNKYFKQKIDFGISVNRGEIVAKKEKSGLKFMSVGKLTTSAKKLASISKGETLLTKEINEKLSAGIKTEKGQEDKMEFYRVKEVKDRSQNQKFLKEFVKRYKEDEKKQK